MKTADQYFPAAKSKAAMSSDGSSGYGDAAYGEAPFGGGSSPPQSIQSPEFSPDESATQTIADHMLGDQPAATGKEDTLGFEPYVTAVAEFLTDSSTKIPLTLSIEGHWGSGKSSFMLQLQEALRSRGKTRIVSFNAWQYNADEGLWAAFIHEFDGKLNDELTFAQKVRARLRLVRLRLSWQDTFDTIKSLLWLTATLVVLVYLSRYLAHGGMHILISNFAGDGHAAEVTNKTIAGIGGFGGTLAALLLLLNQIKDLFKSPASLDKAASLFSRQNYKARLPFIHEVTRDFNALVEAYAGPGEVYVFIDDLDRCEYSKAAELMQALLMLLSSAPRIALIIGLDRDKVAAAMATKQEKLLPYLYKVQPADVYELGMEYGQRFLEKFIQLSYILPVPRTEGLKAMINPEARPVRDTVPESQKSAQAIQIVTGKNDSETLDLMIEMADLIFDHNPRNVKQFVNMFRLQAFIANETGLFGSLRVTRGTGRPMTLPQLGKFVALCLRWPAFVEAASLDPELAGTLEGSLAPYANRTSPLLPQLERWHDANLLKLLLKFGLPDENFSIAGLDFGR